MGIMLCIDGLPLDYTSRHLRQLAEQYQPILRCWVVTDPAGRSLRYGYIEVNNSNDAEVLLTALSGLQLNGRPARVAVVKTA